MNFRLQHQQHHDRHDRHHNGHYEKPHDDISDQDWNNHRPGRIKNLRMIFDNKGVYMYYMYIQYIEKRKEIVNHFEIWPRSTKW